MARRARAASRRCATTRRACPPRRRAGDRRTRRDRSRRLCMRLFRVFPCLPSAAADAPGGALFRPAGGRGRADSPIGDYRCLYATDTPEAAVAQTFGRFDVWDRDLIEAIPATPTVPRSRFALAAFELRSARVRNLNDARVLPEENLRPSDVVTRDLTVTQAWASRIYKTARYAGVQWRSYYNPDWTVAALWDT